MRFVIQVSSVETVLFDMFSHLLLVLVREFNMIQFEEGRQYRNVPEY